MTLDELIRKSEVLKLQNKRSSLKRSLACVENDLHKIIDSFKELGVSNQSELITLLCQAVSSVDRAFDVVARDCN